MAGTPNIAGTGNVDQNYNQLVTLPQNPAQAGLAAVAVMQDQGEITGSPLLRLPAASIFNRLAVGLDTPAFSYYFNSAAQNTAIWRSAVANFTTSQSAGYLTLNASAITSTGSAAIYQTYRTFTMFGGQPMEFEFSEFRSITMPANSQAEVGFFAANLGSSPFTPADGVYFRMASTGLIGVLNYNGVETTVPLLTAAQVVTNDNTTYRIVVNHYRVEFWGASQTSDPRQILGVIPVPAVNGPPFQSLGVPASIRLYFPGVPASAVQLKIANVLVLQQDTNQSKGYPDQLAGMGLMASQGQDGGVMGSTQGLTNSQAAGAGAALTNTTAAAGTGLGGQFSVQPTLAAATDGILCSYQVPAGNVNQTPRSLYVNNIQIQGAVTTALVGGPVVAAYSVAYGHTGVSLATAEGVAAKAPRRMALGYETYAATAAVGVLGSAGLNLTFSTPICVNAGEFIAIVFKNLGTVTTVGVITVLVNINGYVE